MNPNARSEPIGPIDPIGSPPPNHQIPSTAGSPAEASTLAQWVSQCVSRGVARFERIPYAPVALLARFAIAAVFWQSGQTKIEGLAINFVSGEFRLGWPRLSETALALFQDEYRLPLIAPALAAPLAATAEHLLPLLLLIGLGTRLSALALLGMTAVIQIFVYPGAYATHGTWAAVLLMLMMRGAGAVSIDHWLIKQWARPQPAITS